MKSEKIKQSRIFKGRIGRLLIMIVTFLCVFFILLSSVVPKKYELNVGDIAEADIKAPRETIDEYATAVKLNEAIKNVDKQYTKKNEVKQTAIDNINKIFRDILDSRKSPEGDVIKINRIFNNLDVEYEEAEKIYNLSEDKVYSYNKILNDILEDIYDNNNITENKEDLDNAKEIAKNAIEKSEIDSQLKTIFGKIVSSQIKPNFFYDEEKTNEKLEEVKKSVEQVTIKKNQIIVKDGEPVTESQIEILESLGLLSESGETMAMFLLFLILALFVMLILIVQYVYISKYTKLIEGNKVKNLMLINMITVITLVLAKGFSLISVYLIPLAFAPIVISQLIDYRISLVISSLDLIFIAVIAEFDAKVIIIGLINILVASMILRNVQQRNEIMYSMLYLILISTLINFSVEGILSTNMKVVLINCLYSALGVAISSIIAIGTLPFFEMTFNIMTIVKLLEISNPNNPLLKRLLMEAPGTYHHSMTVANLAEVAADEVGANPIITRVGAYYHDVGKLERPYFFKENQYNDDNPHNRITPNLSALIIISHVKDGIELAKKNKIPQRIIDIIREHHGTTLVKYFYYNVKNAAENPDDINPDDYKYLGPIPQSKESAIIMLADSTEAAVRSIKEPNEEKIKKMIYDIVDDKLQSGQLNDSELTLKDIEKIKECFIKSYNGMYHKRIEYPKELKREEQK